MIAQLGRGYSSGMRGFPMPLQRHLASCLFDLDTTIGTSATGSGQWWKNTCPAPADGNSRSAYDLTLGTSNLASTDDPALCGGIGVSTAYWWFDGGDCLRIPANTDFLRNLQKTTGGQAFTLCLCFRASGLGTPYTMLATNAISSQVGIRIQVNAAGRIQFSARGDSASVSTTASALPALSDGTHYMYAVSFDPVTSEIRQWQNSAVKVTASLPLNNCVSDAFGALAVGSTSNGSSPIPYGSQIFAASAFNVFLNDSDIASLLSMYAQRHGRSYA